MIDTTTAVLALRNRALSLASPTTGSTSLSATTTGFARVAGSFLTDGFAIGMEVTPTGFTANGVDVITGVTALTLTTKTARSAENAASGRALTVKLPSVRAWESVHTRTIVGQPFIEEEFIPATSTLRTTNAVSGTIEETGLYVLRWYGVSNYGESATRKSVDALSALFTPGTTLTAGSNTLRVRGDVGPFTGQLIAQGDGWSVLTLTIPWRAFTTNAIAP